MIQMLRVDLHGVNQKDEFVGRIREAVRSNVHAFCNTMIFSKFLPACQLLPTRKCNSPVLVL